MKDEDVRKDRAQQDDRERYEAMEEQQKAGGGGCPTSQKMLPPASVKARPRRIREAVTMYRIGAL